MARANAAEYGLAASISTDDLPTAHPLAAQIDAGIVYVNVLPLLDPAAVHRATARAAPSLELSLARLGEFTRTKGDWIGL